MARKTRVLHGVESLLSWDQETYMPPDAAVIRAEQIKTLAGIVHKQSVSRPFAKKLEQLLLLQDQLSEPQQRALLEWKRTLKQNKALPGRFVEEFASLKSQAICAWDQAKKEKNFKQFEPFLEKILRMVRKKADYLGYENHPYDALLDEYEPYSNKAEVDRIFYPLRTTILTLLKKIKAGKQVEDACLKGPHDPSKQASFNTQLLQAIGFPLSKGRLDLSSHPFSSSAHPMDNRITTRIHPDFLMSNIRSVLHECGHAFYEMGLPVEEYGTPLGEAISLGIHESQSRWWECLVGLSQPFWRYCLPLLQKHFGGALNHVDLQTFWRAINKVEPSYIRVEADEVTYPLHVILRYELELQLVEGSLKVRDLPEAWNAKMQELLGITPRNAAEGCLQDIHWSMGAFGYFPTYALGNLYAGHLFTAFQKKFPDWDERVARGEFLFMREWLTQEVHRYGKRYTGRELLEKATGQPFSSKAYEVYLEAKYTDSSFIN